MNETSIQIFIVLILSLTLHTLLIVPSLIQFLGQRPSLQGTNLGLSTDNSTILVGSLRIVHIDIITRCEGFSNRILA